MSEKDLNGITFKELADITWGVADIVRDKVDADTRDYMEIVLPMLLSKRILDIREEYVEDYIKQTDLYKLDEDIISAIKENSDRLPVYKTKEIKQYCITWDDINEFPALFNPNGEEKELELKKYPGVKIKTKAKNKVDFMASVIDSFEDETIERIMKISKVKEKLFNIVSEDVFSEIVSEYSYTSFSYKNAPSDIFSDVYMYLIAKFAESGGKKGGEFFTPRKLCDGAVALLDPILKENGETKIADITAGSATFLNSISGKLKEQLIEGGMSKEEAAIAINNRVKLYFQEKSGTSLILGEMNLLLANITNFKAYKANSITEYKENIGKHRNTCDYIVGNPPYGLKDYGFTALFGDGAPKKQYNANAHEPRWNYGIVPKGESDMALTSTFLDMLNDTGKGVLVLPLGTLFKDSTKHVRASLLENDLIEGIVLLPSDMFVTTSIPVCIWIFNKDKKEADKDKIFMINASEHYDKEGKFNVWKQQETIEAYLNRKETNGFAEYISKEDLVENDYNFSVQRYIYTEEPEEEININELMEEIVEIDKKIAVDKELMNNIMKQVLALKGNAES